MGCNKMVCFGNVSNHAIGAEGEREAPIWNDRSCCGSAASKLVSCSPARSPRLFWAPVAAAPEGAGRSCSRCRRRQPGGPGRKDAYRPPRPVVKSIDHRARNYLIIDLLKSLTSQRRSLSLLIRIIQFLPFEGKCSKAKSLKATGNIAEEEESH